jgi:hypothetical protein
VVNVTNRADVYVRLAAVELFLGHAAYSRNSKICFKPK